MDCIVVVYVKGVLSHNLYVYSIVRCKSSVGLINGGA